LALCGNGIGIAKAVDHQSAAFAGKRSGAGSANA
jgi:hypothetical protein